MVFKFAFYNKKEKFYIVCLSVCLNPFNVKPAKPIRPKFDKESVIGDRWEKGN